MTRACYLAAAMSIRLTVTQYIYRLSLAIQIQIKILFVHKGMKHYYITNKVDYMLQLRHNHITHSFC